MIGQNKINFSLAALILMGLPLLWVGMLLLTTEINFEPEASKDVYRFSFQLGFGETKWWYLMINLGAFFFPFVLSFDKKVHFYKKWKFLFPGILLNAVLFISWDIFFTHAGIWGFNARYVNFMIFGLPLGEWLFFVTVPYACVFVHECLLCYFKSDPLKKYDRSILLILIFLFASIGIINIFKAYTAWTFLLSAAFLLLHLLYIPNTYRTRFYLAYFVSLIPFTLINGILTGGYNEEPVVLYNNSHNLSSLIGFRFFSIPFDDFIYGFLMMLITVTIYEKLRAQKIKSSEN
jgi:lycopene cyclase domain-containing protein